MHLEGRYDITNINEIDPIEIPEEVKENAVDEFDEELFSEEMSIEEIQDIVDFTIPEVTELPEGYTLTESFYDESMKMVLLNYEKDLENGFMLNVSPSESGYADITFDETMDGESVTIQGNDAVFYDMDFFYGLTWEQDGLFIDFSGGGPDLTKEKFLEIAESIK
jgi:predicted HicB family RNase H-like nuclease